VRWVYHWRDRLAVPAIVSLMLASVLTYPVELMLVAPKLLHGPQHDIVRPAIMLVLFIWFFVMTYRSWEYWRSPESRRIRRVAKNALRSITWLKPR
jgi:ABC-type transport system involved in Fe-S cluster assembly fused permease/ATPase subunit